MNSSDPENAEVHHDSESPNPDTTDRTSDVTTGLDPPPNRGVGLTGRSLGDYLLLEQIGSGGGGHVYRAQHRRMDRIVALKVFSRGVLGDEVQVRRFEREVRAAAKLIHPNIVLAYDAGEHQSMHFLVMEYVEGKSLGKLVHGAGPLPVREAVRYIAQAAQGLAYAHAEGIVHRDVKPDNIMVEPNGTIKLLDMGLARWNGIAFQDTQESQSISLTAQGIVLGTVGYISPEQICNASNVDERCDIYSLGCTLYFLLTGRAPYQGTVLEVFRAHEEAPIPQLKHARNDVPYGLDNIYKRMLAKAPDDRIQSAREVVELLRPYCGELPEVADALADWQSATLHGDTPALEQSAGVNSSLGFDLSDSFLFVSTINAEGEPALLADRDGTSATPAVVHYSHGRFEFGSGAIRTGATSESGLVDRLASRLGSGAPMFRIASRSIPHEAIAAVLISKRVNANGGNLKQTPRLCFTIPSCFGEVRRRAYRDAYFIAVGSDGTPVNSATAVAVQFCFLHGWLNPNHSLSKKTILVFRCGRTSFDATVYRVEDRRLAAVALVGDSGVGEVSWENRLLERLLGNFDRPERKALLDDKRRLKKLRRQIESTRNSLIQGKKSLTLRFTVGGKTIEDKLDAAAIAQLGGDFLGRLQTLTEQALSGAGATWENLDHVLLAGSATQMPFVHEAVKSWSGNREICSLAGPEIASGGAALLAENAGGRRSSILDFAVEDVSSHGYGVCCTDPGAEAVPPQIAIPQGSRLPTTAKVTLSKPTTRQNEVNFQVLELDAAQPASPTVLGVGCIRNLPPGLPAGTPIEIEVSLDSSGIVSVFAISLATGRRFNPEYRPAAGLSATERMEWRTWLLGLDQPVPPTAGD